MVNVAVPQATYEVVCKLADIAHKPIDEIIVSLLHAGFSDFAEKGDLTPAALDATASYQRMRARMGETWRRRLAPR